MKLVRLLMVATMIILFSGWHIYFSESCKNTVLGSVSSPNKKLTVIVFERGCGATTGFSTHISMLTKSNKLENNAGNIFIAKGKPDQYIVHWESDDKVIIKGYSKIVFKKKILFNGVTITYE